MEKLELLVEGANGQMEINFESLELLTSAEFVSRIKSQLDMGAELFSIDNYKSFVDVKLFNCGRFSIYNFSKGLKITDITFVNAYEVREMYAKLEKTGWL